ncbi:helix-turn-helix domain-containing protein [Streptomyces luteolifulvus]|uniref:Helix-turn-helix domain-containing protein n=1 Tax=Streptomyces luteolifulvus TaxID=2615112 RepID=A0A6H9UN57_9ACTN|nr:helix-turn-helix domain-containing protein [Streptomyces luteolifulvus]KAB1139052.1 helix-turn-helix domain-containing protein [Streptomyces luteolifulvus]
MPKILKVSLSEQQRAELRRWLTRRDLPRFERLRLDAVRLLDRGMSAPEAASLLECDVTTVRGAVHRFEAGGLAAPAEAPRAGRQPRITAADRRAVAALLDAAADEGRTWIASGLAEWLLAERGVEVSAAWLTELLRRDGFRWKRTRDSLRPKADPALQQAARTRLEGTRLHGWRPSQARGT